MILSCKITRGMILVVGKVTEGVQGRLRGFLGVHGVVKGQSINQYIFRDITIILELL